MVTWLVEPLKLFRIILNLGRPGVDFIKVELGVFLSIWALCLFPTFTKQKAFQKLGEMLYIQLNEINPGTRFSTVYVEIAAQLSYFEIFKNCEKSQELDTVRFLNRAPEAYGI